MEEEIWNSVRIILILSVLNSSQRNQNKRCKTVVEKEEDFSHDIETAVIRDAQ